MINKVRFIIRGTLPVLLRVLLRVYQAKEWP